MPPSNQYSDSQLFKVLEKSLESIDLEALISLFDTIQITDKFENLDQAIRRLTRILKQIALLNSKFETEQVNRWLYAIEGLSKVIKDYISSNNFNKLFDSIILQKGRRTGLLEPEIESNHPFYAALIVECTSKQTEESLIKLLTVMLTAMLVVNNQGEKSNNPLAKDLLIVKTAAKRLQKDASWQDYLVNLLSDDINADWLSKLSDKCQNQPKDKNLNKKQKEFISVLSALIGILQSTPDHRFKKPTKNKNSEKQSRSEKFKSSEVDGFSISLLSIRQITRKPAKSENYEVEALAPEDWEEQAEIICTPELNLDESPQTELEQVIASRFAGYYYEQNNQHLPVRWGSLNPYEIKHLLGFLETPITAKVPLTQAAQCLIGLVLVTGQSSATLLSSQLNGSLSEQNPHNFFLKQGHWYWQHMIPPLRDCYQPKGNIKALVKPVENSLTLPLPKLIEEFLTTLVSNHSCSLEAIFTCNEQELLQEVSAIFSRLNENRRSRITLTRLRRVLFDSLMQVSGDELAAYTILGLDGERPLTGLYYTAFAVTELVDLYRQGMNRLIPDSICSDNFRKTIPDGLIGSALSISPETYKGFVSELQNRCEELLRGTRTLERIIEAHNLYTAYIVLLLQFSSGHRAVNDPFSDPDGIVLNGNAALITDKVELVEHEGRLVFLGAVARAQLETYRRHLAGLNSALSKYSPDFNILINSLLKAKVQRLIPYLFFLKAPGLNRKNIQWESVTPSSMMRVLRDIWPFPLNMNRHILATELRRYHVPSEYISYQLGHVQTGQLAYGRFALLAPAQVSTLLIPALSKLEERYGWKVINGLRPYGTPEEIIKAGTSEFPKFGPQLRQYKRELAESDAKAVKNAIDSAGYRALPDSASEIPPILIETILDKIKDSSVPLPQQIRRQNLFYRYLRLGRSLNRWQSSLPPQTYVLNNEKASLTYSDGSDLANLQIFKCQFMNWLISQFSTDQYPLKNSANINQYYEYLAACRLSALLFGQLCQSAYLDQLEMALSQHSMGKNGRFWVNFYGSNCKLQYRWHPDALSISLLLHTLPWLQEQNKIQGKLNSVISSVDKSLKTLLLKLAHVCGLQNQLANKPFNRLINWVRKDNALHFPGVVRAFLDQEIENWSLPERAWLRLISGEPAENLEDVAEEYTTIESNAEQNKNPKSINDTAAIKALRASLHQALSPSASGASQTNTLGNTALRRKQLIRAFAEWKTKWTGQISPTLLMLQGWLLSLLSPNAGTSPLKPSSVLTYLNAIGSALIEESGAVNLAMLEETELYEFYERVILAGKESSQGYRADRLLSFHEYLVADHGAVSLDFSELPTKNSTYAADANIVTPREYKVAFDLLLNDPYQTRTGQIHQALALCLMYRNGLRVMEVFKLQLCDVVAEPPERIYIRNNELGPCKTLNGVRQIPFWLRLEEAEQALLTDWINHCQRDPKRDARKPLLSEPLTGNLINRNAVCRRIVTALRLATGDASVKLRHLRHSFATYYLSASCEQALPTNNLMLTAWSGQLPHLASQFHRQIFGQAIPTRRNLYQLAALMGHSSPETTLRNYIHSLDWLIPVFRPSLPVVLQGEVIMKLLGYAPGSLRTTVTRKNINISDLSLESLIHNLIKKHFKDASSKPNSPKKLVLPPIVLTEKTLPTLAELENLLYLYQNGYQDIWLADHLNLNVDTVKLCIKSAIETQEGSQYRRFRLKNINKVEWPSLVKEHDLIELTVKPFSLLNMKAIQHPELIECLEKALIEPNEDLEKFLALWEKGYQLKSSAYYFNNQSDTAAWVSLLVKFGINRSSVFLEIPANTDDFYQNNKAMIFSLLKDLGIPQDNITLKKSFLKSAKLKANKNSKNLKLGIAIAKPDESNFEGSKSKPKFNTSVINYYLFLASILLNVKLQVS